MAKPLRIPTGIPGLDDMIEGGIPAGRTIIVIGGPGTGKTILCGQYLNHGITTMNERGMYVSLEEDKEHFLQEMSRFNWDFEKHEKEGNFVFLDAKPANGTAEESHRSLDCVLRDMSRQIRDHEIKRVAVDAISSLVFEFPEISERRKATLKLVDAMTPTKATTIMTSELRAPGFERPVQMEEYLAHGTVVLQTVKLKESLSRVLQIEKMRETKIDAQQRPYQITPTGITVFPQEKVLY